MKLFLFSPLLSLCLYSCNENGNANHSPLENHAKEESEQSLVSPKRELPLSWKNLVNVQTLNAGIRVDLKYASSDNFMGMVLYDTLSSAYLQKEVAQRLAKCQQYLSELQENRFLLVYDCVRPLAVQQKMWDALDSIPVSERVKFVSNPKNGSIHNYGCAVDLTICDEKGIPLDMGAGYDDMRKIAYPSLEANFLASGELTRDQLNNRQLLRKVMRKEGFYNIPTEWWHFNAFTREEAKKRYEIVL